MDVRIFIGAAWLALAGLTSRGQTSTPGDFADGDPGWGSFVEADFPFFSSVLDARNLGELWPAQNLTPRGLILNLGHGTWACFDTELLRIAAVWTGTGVSSNSMAQISYHSAGVKVPEGQRQLPQIVGRPWMATGLYPGWQTEAVPRRIDPRPPGPDPREVGRGPLPGSSGRFRAVHFDSGVVRLEYEVAGAVVSEWITVEPIESQAGQLLFRRRFHLEQVPRALIVILGEKIVPAHIAIVSASAPRAKLIERVDADGLVAVRVGPTTTPLEWSFEVKLDAEAGVPLSRDAVRWPERVITRATPASFDHAATDPVVLDEVGLPFENRWKRNVRLADLAFFPDGRAAAVTFDGDVWTIEGLDRAAGGIRWRRFTSGLHEPLSIAIRDGVIYVFDRNGIWRLRDTNLNGEADVHELVSNVFTQTAETREYANGMRIAPDGAFIIAKGGQQGTTRGRDNGQVLRISADGAQASIMGWGFRQPFIGVHPATGLITASDQQGHHVPATPLHIVTPGRYYGFLTGLVPKEEYPAPIEDPATWIPHAVNASGASQVWLESAAMGPLAGALVHLGYYRPEIFLVRMNERTVPVQAAVTSLSQALRFAPLNGAINPADGFLYITGFQIWGTIAQKVSGLARVRPAAAAQFLPRAVVPMKEGVLIRFDSPLHPAATNLANFSVERWNYIRTANYGSPHLKRDGGKGQESMQPTSAYLSRDGRSLFLGLPDMAPVMQMRVGWSLRAEAGGLIARNVYFTPRELSGFEPGAEGFAPIEVDLTPRAAAGGEAETPITAAEGRRLAELMGCAACHSSDGTVVGKVGPSWRGLYGSLRQFVDGTEAAADEAYLRESIHHPAARVVRGFDRTDTGMPSYEGVLTAAQLEAVILYLKALR